jgi:hypothetical protein
MFQVLQAAAHEVVDHPDGEPAVQQEIDQMAADEAGAAGDDSNPPG